MRWLKRGAEDGHDDTDQPAVEPSIRRVQKLEERGVHANGVITGVQFSSYDESTRQEYAVAVQTADGWKRYGVRTQPPESHRLRLGLPVVVKVERDRALLDWSAMSEAWGFGSRQLSQESMRKPPADGIVDTDIDFRVQRRLKKWTRTEATIRSVQRRTLGGMQTANWDIDLDLGDGRTTRSSSDAVPSYAQWYATPGAVVPAVIDPGDPSKACIDWAAFALAQVDAPGFDDDPPSGSIAAEIEREATEASSVMGSTPTPAAAVDPAAPVTLDATMQAWVDTVRSGHMKRKEFDKALDDWAAAGMCTAAQVAAAQAAAAP